MSRHQMPPNALEHVFPHDVRCEILDLFGRYPSATHIGITVPIEAALMQHTLHEFSLRWLIENCPKMAEVPITEVLFRDVFPQFMGLTVEWDVERFYLGDGDKKQWHILRSLNWKQAEPDPPTGYTIRAGVTIMQLNRPLHTFRTPEYALDDVENPEDPYTFLNGALPLLVKLARAFVQHPPKNHALTRRMSS